MFFNKKSKKETMDCDFCGKKVSEKYEYCPYCGETLADPYKDAEEFGILGRDDMSDEEIFRQQFSIANMGTLDKIFNSIVNNLVKNIDAQVKEGRTEIKNFPNGIRIQMGGNGLSTTSQPKQQQNSFLKKEINAEQLKRITSLPKKSAKSSLKRLSDKVVYELTTPGVSSTDDIFISKLESGYEIKAIGDKKIYVNSLPVSLPLKHLSLDKDKLTVEFRTHQH